MSVGKCACLRLRKHNAATDRLIWNANEEANEEEEPLLPLLACGPASHTLHYITHRTNTGTSTTAFVKPPSRSVKPCLGTDRYVRDRRREGGEAER